MLDEFVAEYHEVVYRMYCCTDVVFFCCVLVGSWLILEWELPFLYGVRIDCVLLRLRVIPYNILVLLCLLCRLWCH
jgi:hypothetical protein